MDEKQDVKNMKFSYSKLIIFVLCCGLLNGCGIARRIIMAPVNILTENEYDTTKDINETALAFADTPEGSEKTKLYVVTYEISE